MKLASNTNWNLYRCFIAVYESGGFNQATEHIDVARPNIKKNVETLSYQLGVKLFTPNPRGAEPTSDAIRLYPIIKDAVGLMLQAEQGLREFTNQSEAVIRMIVPMTLVGTHLGEFFQYFKEKYPNVKFQLCNRAMHEIYGLFMLGKVDLVINLESVCKQYKIKTIDILTINHVFIASKNFLKKRGLNESLSKCELSKLPIIATLGSVDMVADENGLKISPFIETATIEPIFPLVKQGVGIGLYGKEYWEKQNNFGDIVKLTVTDVEVLPQVKIVCGYNKPTLSKAAQIFIDELLTFFSTEKSSS